MSCDCIAQVNLLLKDKNAAVETNLFGAPMTLVSLYKVDSKKRGKPPFFQATYCPFCGVKYDPPTLKATA